MEVIRNAIMAFVEVENPATVRQVYYHLTTLGVIDKTEAEYKQTVCRMLVNMRRDGQLPYGWIADSTRWMRKPTTYGSMEDMLRRCQQTYRRALWDDQEAYVEVWLEKEALAGVLVDVTAEWDVPLMVTRGYPSISFLHSAGEVIAAEERPTYLYYFGDHDPSGVDIDRFVEKELRAHAPDCDLHFFRVAVRHWQIAKFNLPTRPTKKSDSRAAGFGGRSVEVDAISPTKLRELCEEFITQHIDHDQLQRTRNVEEAERDTLSRIMEAAQ